MATTTLNPAFTAWFANAIANAHTSDYYNKRQFVDKPAAILAIEQKIGKPLDPVWPTRTVEGPRGTVNVEYGVPSSYRFDNGQSQYVSVSPAGVYQNTMNRVTGMKEFMQSGVPGVLMAALPFAGPTAATAANAINLATAIDQKDPLKILTSGASLYAGLPGSNPSTVSTVKDLNTALKIGSAIDKKDPIAGLAAIAQISGVDPSVATTAQGLSAINAAMSGDPSKILNSFTNFFSSNLFGKNNTSPDVKALPPDQVAALTGDQITDNLLLPLEEAPPLPNNTVTEVIAGGDEPVLPVINDKELTSPAASDQAFQDALDRSTTSDIPVENKPIEDVLTDAGLVTDEEPPFTVEVVGSNLTPLSPLENAPPLPDNTVTEVDLTKDKPIENVLTDAGLSSGEDNPFTVEVTGIANPLLPLEPAPPLPNNTVTEVIAGEDTPLLPLEPAPPLPDNTVKEVIADTTTGGGNPPVVKPPVVKPPVRLNPKYTIKPTSVPTSVPTSATVATADDLRKRTLVDEILGFDVSADFDPLWLLNDRTQAKTTKIASGGYLDDLLADPTSFNDLLRILRS